MRGLGFALGSILALAVLFKVAGRADVSFESSTGDWADSEVLFKGRDFTLIERQFQSFQATCSKPSAALVRTTAFPWYNVFAWPSYFTEPKWQVPFQAARLSTYQRPSCSA